MLFTYIPIHDLLGGPDFAFIASKKIKYFHPVSRVPQIAGECVYECCMVLRFVLVVEDSALGLWIRRIHVLDPAA